MPASKQTCDRYVDYMSVNYISEQMELEVDSVIDRFQFLSIDMRC